MREMVQASRPYNTCGGCKARQDLGARALKDPIHTPSEGKENKGWSLLYRGVPGRYTASRSFLFGSSKRLRQKLPSEGTATLVSCCSERVSTESTKDEDCEDRREGRSLLRRNSFLFRWCNLTCTDLPVRYRTIFKTDHLRKWNCKFHNVRFENVN